MKIRTILLSALFFPLLSFSQNGTDSPQQASYVSQKAGGVFYTALTGFSKSKMAFELSSDASGRFYLNMSGAGWGAFTIDSANKLVLVLSNDSSVKVRATSLQSFEPDLVQNTYNHKYNITKADLEALSRYQLMAVRKYSFTTYFDIQVPRENAKRLQKICLAFLASLPKQEVERKPIVEKAIVDKPTVDKLGVVKSGSDKATVELESKRFAGVKQINLKDIRSYIGDSVAFCSKVFSTRYFEGSKDGPTVLDVQADFSDPLIDVVILEQDRLNFSSAPEKRYLNKDVCISGVVSLRNNIPYLLVHSSDQIKVKSPLNLTEVGLFEGDTVTVAGHVFPAPNPQEAGANFTLLNMGTASAEPPLTLLIDNTTGKNSDFSAAGFLNKNIRVTGKVVRYRNNPQIYLRSKDQVTLLADQDSSAAYVVPQAEEKKEPPVQTVVSTEPENETTKPVENPLVGKAAAFPGGKDSLKTFFSRNLILPKELQPGEEKQVVVSFRIDATGGCRNIQIVESPGSAFDREARRVLLKMPRWKPAYFNGSYFESKITETITFKKEGNTASH